MSQNLLETAGEDGFKLYYFDARGLAEPIRYILKLKKIPFEDHRIPLTSLPAIVPPEIKKDSPFGQLPILKFGDHVIGQSLCIARYLATCLGLTGKNGIEAARCDELAEGARDFWSLWIAILFTDDEGKKEELRKIAMERGSDRYLAKFNEILKSKQKDCLYLVGNGLTWADLWVAHAVDNVQRGFGVDLVSEFPLLGKYLTHIFETPGIKEWIVERPETKL